MEPALDTRKLSFDARTVTAHSVAIVFEDHRLTGFKRGDKVLDSGQDEGVGLLFVEIARQPAIGLARDRRQRQLPTDAKRAVARSRIVVQGELQPAATPWRRGDRHAKAASAGKGVGRELLPQAA